MKLPVEIESFVNYALERYKNQMRKASTWNSRFQLFKALYEGYQYEDDMIGPGKTRLRDIQDRAKARDLRGSDFNIWRFRVNDNIIQEIIDYFLVDYIITDPDWDMEPINDDFAAKEVAKTTNRIIEYTKEFNEFSVKNLEAGLLAIMTGTTYFNVYENEEMKEVGIGYRPYDGVIDDGEALDLEDSDYIIIPHDIPIHKFKEQFIEKYKELHGDEDPYKLSSQAPTNDVRYSLGELMSAFDNARTYANTKNQYKLRVLEILTYDEKQIFMVQVGEDNFEPMFYGENPYPMRYPWVRLRFKASALSGQGTTWMADLIEIQNAVNYLTNAAVNNVVEQANFKAFVPSDVVFTDQDGDTDIIGAKPQVFKFVASPTYNGPILQYVQAPQISVELINQRDALITRTYSRLNITPAARGMLPASRTSAKSLEFMVNQRNNQSQPYMVLYKNALQRLAVKILQMAKVVYSEDKLLQIVGEDSLYSVREFKKYLPDNPTVKIIAGTEVDLTATEKDQKLQYILQYGGIEAFNSQDLLTMFGLNKDETFTAPGDRWRGAAQMQIADILAGGDPPKPEKEQNHLVFTDQVSQLKSSKAWELASDETKAKIEEFERAHYIAHEQDILEKELWTQLAKQRIVAMSQQLGLQQPAPQPAGQGGVPTAMNIPSQVSPVVQPSAQPVGVPAVPSNATM